MRLAVLSSSRGTILRPLITLLKQHPIGASIKIIIANREQALILSQAQDLNIPNFYLTEEAKINIILKNYNIDLILLIGYAKIISHNFLQNWQNKILNIHPSLLPKYGKLYNQAVHQAVLANQESETGCTVHWVTEEIDGGPIVTQKRCLVYQNDTVESLKNRVQSLEPDAYLEAIKLVIKNNNKKC